MPNQDVPSVPSDRVALVRANLERILADIDRISPPQPVRIVAVTKYVDLEWCVAAIHAGVAELGENRIQNGVAKFKALRSQGHKFTAHMVGTIQSNKAKRVAGVFDWVQSLDSLRVARFLQKKADELDLTIQVLIEVNIDSEPQKSGIVPEEVLSFSHELSAFPHLKLRGLMCIPQAPEASGVDAAYERRTRSAFARTRELYQQLAGIGASAPNSTIDTLSMGMSLDYSWAVAEGANMVRIGRALFLPSGGRLPELQ